VKRADANLEGDKLLAGVPELLISFLNSVIIMSPVIYAQRTAYIQKIYVSITRLVILIASIKDNKLPENSVSIAMNSAFMMLSLMRSNCASKFSEVISMSYLINRRLTVSYELKSFDLWES
jgi:hypothetical protein